WNPLVTLEVAGMGHVDALGVAAVVAGVLFLLSPPEKTREGQQGPQGRQGQQEKSGFPGRLAAWAAAGALAKLVPLAAFPMWARQTGRPWRFLGLAGGLVALALAPVVIASRGVPPGLV